MKPSFTSSLAQNLTPEEYSVPAEIGPDPATLTAVPAEPQAKPVPTRDPSSLGPDVILPEQYYETRGGLEEVAGERALMLAVLEDGIRCYQEHLTSPRVRPRLLARQAEKWIRSHDCEWPFSFNNICDSLALDPESLRQKLLTPTADGEKPRPRPSSHRVYRLTPRVKPPRQR